MTQERKPQTIRELLPVASAWLAERGVEESRLDTELLLAHVLELSRMQLYMDHDRPLVASELEQFRALMRRRGERREPVAYLIGERGFCGLDIEVGPGVLIPRPETEHLVEVGCEELGRLAIERGAGAETLRAADVGTGSGCVALALLDRVDDLRVWATDRSAAALRIARRNAERCEAGERLLLGQADLLGPAAPGSLDLIVSNPPYVLPTEDPLLSPEVRDHEPRSALFDAEGLPLTQRLVEQAARALRPQGALAIETGFDKAPLVEGFFQRAGFADVRRVEDLSGIERIVVGRKAG